MSDIVPASFGFWAEQDFNVCPHCKQRNKNKQDPEHFEITWMPPIVYLVCKKCNHSWSLK